MTTPEIKYQRMKRMKPDEFNIINLFLGKYFEIGSREVAKRQKRK